MVGVRLLVAGPKPSVGKAPEPAFIELDDVAIDAAVPRFTRRSARRSSAPPIRAKRVHRATAGQVAYGFVRDEEVVADR